VHIVGYASKIVRLCVINLVRLTNLDSLNSCFITESIDSSLFR
jgi:hypothetical protein